MLKEKSMDNYRHIMQELIKSRAKYMEVSYQEKKNLIFNVHDKKTDQKHSSKKVASLIAWLHESLVNELQILDHTALSSDRYLESLNFIFTKDLAKNIKNKVDEEIH